MLRVNFFQLRCSYTTDGTRAWVRFDTLPNVTTEVLMSTTATSLSARVGYNTATGTISAWYSTSKTDSSVTPTLGQWYLLEMSEDTSTATSTFDWAIDGVPQTQVTIGQAAHDLLGPRFGMYVAGQADFYVDDFATTQSTSDYPIPTGYVDTSDQWVSGEGID